MAHYQIILVYDGTQYAGFQRLDSTTKTISLRTVQGEFEKVLHDLGWVEKSILSAGRTDRGVHASGQVVTFNLEWAHSNEDLCRALNARLPEDIAVRSVKNVPADWHARYRAIARTYHYVIYCAEHRDPLLERYAWKIWPPVNFDRLNDAADLVVGLHDFRAFGNPPRQNGNTVRKVWSAHWNLEYQPGCVQKLRFEITANAFLYHMVRHLVFTQVQVGQGKLELDDLKQAIAGVSLPVTGLAPANGLSLIEVKYDR
jgi:tRNA pseudouridine38-40 synthase